MIVIDSSAIIALLRGEPEAEAIDACMESAQSLIISAANYVELGTVMAGRRTTNHRDAVNDLDRLLAEAGITVAPVTEDLAREALRARIKYGMGFGLRKGLNFGDCFAYALAKRHKAPLLFVGDDFCKTDVNRAL